MAKCLMCNSRKGQRKCLREDGMVCSQCCGETRQAEQCGECAYYRDNIPVRRYVDVPRFSTQTMDSDMQLQSYGYTIEASLCQLDYSRNMSLKDATALKILEMLLDKFHFHDPDTTCDDSLVCEGFDAVVNSISADLSDVSEEIIVKILGVIYYIARRRSRGGREYFNVIQQYVGMRVAPGVRVLPNQIITSKVTS
jgi:hypothetical protein